MLGKKFQGIGGQKYLEERAHVQMTGCNATHNYLKIFLKEYSLFYLLEWVHGLRTHEG